MSQATTLRDVIRAAEAKGHKYVQLIVERRRSPANWDRVRVYPGLFGRCVGEIESPHPPPFGPPGRYLVDVLLDDAQRAYARATLSPSENRP